MNDVAEKKPNLIDISKRYGSDIRTLDKLKHELGKVPTTDLVVSYPDINDFKNTVCDFRDAVRDELVESRIYDVDVEEDEKGNRYLSKKGRHLKFNKRTSDRLNSENAKKVLTEKGLYHNSLKRSVKVKDSDFVLDTMEEVIRNLEDMNKFIDSDDLEVEISRLKSVLKRGLKVTKTIDEKKVDSLKELDFITEGEKSGMYDSTESYALFVVKEGKK